LDDHLESPQKSSWLEIYIFSDWIWWAHFNLCAGYKMK
jgi:hypothetical protein